MEFIGFRWFRGMVPLNNEMLDNAVLNSATINSKGLEGLDGLES